MAKYYNEASRKAAQKYMAKNSLSIAFRLSKVYEQDLIAIYKSIPDSQKAGVFKDAIRRYAMEHAVTMKSKSEQAEQE